MNHVAEEHIGQSKDGKTPATVRFLIDKETFQRVKDASFKNPFFIPSHEDKIGPKLMESITIWMNAKSTFVEEKRIPGSEKLNSLNLSVYCSSEVAKVFEEERMDNRSKTKAFYFLVGDAAFGVPFFRALNNGLLCGSKLAVTIHDLMKCMDEEGSHDVAWNVVQSYSKHVLSLARNEIMRAKNKREVLKLAQLSTKINGISPFQVIRLPKEKVQRLKETNPGFVLPPKQQTQKPAEQPDLIEL